MTKNPEREQKSREMVMLSRGDFSGHVKALVYNTWEVEKAEQREHEKNAINC